MTVAVVSDIIVVVLVVLLLLPCVPYVDCCRFAVVCCACLLMFAVC